MALANHRAWLLGHAQKLFSFFERRLINPLGGFYELDEEGRPTAPGYDAADKPAGTFSQPQGSFALTPPLISWVGQARTSSLITELVFCGVATATPTTLGKGDPIYEQWYRRIWNLIAARFIDRNKGSGEHRSMRCARMQGHFSEKLTSATLCKLVSL
jgi:mannose/cellobiose epimerase-like protein (N-acyl-D-glucosamine 2-epimerase family)